MQDPPAAGMECTPDRLTLRWRYGGSCSPSPSRKKERLFLAFFVYFYENILRIFLSFNFRLRGRGNG